MIFQGLARYMYNQNIIKYQIMFPLCLHIINYKRYSCWLLFLCWSFVHSQSKVYSSDTWCILMYITSWNTSFHICFILLPKCCIYICSLLTSGWPSIVSDLSGQFALAYGTNGEEQQRRSARRPSVSVPRDINVRAWLTQELFPRFCAAPFEATVKICQDWQQIIEIDLLLGRPGSSFWSSLMLNGWKD